MAHKLSVVKDKTGRHYIGRCTCGQTSGPNWFDSPHPAEDWVERHKQNVQRALAHLHKAPGGLRVDMEHAQKMMDDPNTPTRQREQWRVIYEGARNRLGLGTVLHEAEEEKLW